MVSDILAIFDAKKCHFSLKDEIALKQHKSCKTCFTTYIFKNLWALLHVFYFEMVQTKHIKRFSKRMNRSDYRNIFLQSTTLLFSKGEDTESFVWLRYFSPPWTMIQLSLTKRIFFQGEPKIYDFPRRPSENCLLTIITWYQTKK